MKRFQLNIHTALLVCIIIALFLSGLVAYQYWHLNKELIRLDENNTDLATELNQTKQDNLDLLTKNQEQQSIIDSYGGQIKDISSTVGDLTKLSLTDPQLLQKYSKVYFLNENYVPSALTDIEEGYYYKSATNIMIHAKVWPYLRNLIKDAHDHDIELLAASAYRSFYTQEALKNSYKVTYGSGANSFSADQGYSEHQLGTTIDFTTTKLGADFSNFANDSAYKWLLDNAYKYGFILSYPQGNAYYKFEPWHWRFVGVDLATFLHEEKKNFYDVDQREINKYLIKIFD